ncbi:efflux transporter outer membrane subunit [Leeia oryzae]|uniref:efflux transporter outer membrane subunit n=1 Tax=Leeia oryzae TaxID=356662 RepID=UPI000377B7A7|nr:efflux transporter outer membrane subunit [Leeia oryzae]
MKHIALTLVTSGLLLTGCGSMAPEYKRPDAPVPQSYPGEAGGQRAELAAWKQVILQPQLQQLVALTLQNNRDIRISALNIEAAKAQYQITRADSFPAVNATGTNTATGSLDGGNTSHAYEVGVSVPSFELDFFGRVRSLKNAALDSYLASEAAHQTVQMSLVTSTVQAWMQLSADLNGVEQTRNSLNAHMKTLELTRARQSRGVASELDVRQAETALQASRISLIGYQGQVAQDKNALRLLVGADVPENLLPDAHALQQPLLADVPAGMPSDLLARRPDIVEAEHNLKAANANIGAAKAAFFPKITLTGFAGSASSSLDGLFDNGSGIWRFVPQISLPLFNAGQNQASLDLAEVRKNQQIASYEKTIQTAFKEVANALALRSQLTEQQDAVDGQLKAAERAQVLAEARYTQGLDSYLPLLDAQRTVDAARISQINQLLQKQKNSMYLFQVLGGKMND